MFGLVGVCGVEVGFRVGGLMVYVVGLSVTQASSC